MKSVDFMKFINWNSTNWEQSKQLILLIYTKQPKQVNYKEKSSVLCENMGGPDSKISTVDVESGDNMATLPVSRAHTSSTDTAEKNNAANKEMELKNVMPKPLERYYPANWLNGTLLSHFYIHFKGFQSNYCVFEQKKI